jgi:L-glyceraldehyde 3-phosphate reductase
MSLSWVLRDGRVTSALAGASSPKQVTENAAAVRKTTFADDELAAIDALLNKLTLPPSLWAGE